MAQILIVEDDQHFRDTVRSILEDEGWAVDTAADSRQALASFARTRPELLVVDWGLRESDAEVVAKALRRSDGPEVPILLITADGNAARKAGRLGAFAYLQKPFDMAKLIDLVRSALKSP
jgi:DNA-binding response OmpR family regulator